LSNTLCKQIKPLSEVKPDIEWRSTDPASHTDHTDSTWTHRLGQTLRDIQTDTERDIEWCSTDPASSATSCINASTWFCGVVNVDDAHIVSSIT